MIEISLTTVAAYGSFVLAEQFHDSGVIATVVAGMLCGNFAARTGMSPSTRVAVETFWEYLSFALNSIVFLLIGFEVNLEALRSSWQMIVVAYLAVTLARMAVVYGVSSLLHNRPGRLPRSWGLVLGWGGLRGGVSMVLALGLPATLPYRELLVSTTFGVVLLTILVQGLTVPLLVRRLGLVQTPAGRREHELARGELLAVDSALAELVRIERSHGAAPDVVQKLRKEYEDRFEQAKGRLHKVHDDRGALRRQEFVHARRQLLLAEKQQLLESLHQGELEAEAVERLLSDVDARLVHVEEGRIQDVPAPDKANGSPPSDAGTSSPGG
jgi:CPA1 family monovalent cation:H+ antiporter